MFHLIAAEIEKREQAVKDHVSGELSAAELDPLQFPQYARGPPSKLHNCCRSCLAGRRTGARRTRSAR